MLTLIKRELEDHAIHFALAVAISATLVGILAYGAYAGLEATVAPLMFLGVAALIGCCAMGVAQVYTDRTNRISSFLATLAVTRGQILLARITVGVLALATILLPAAVAATVLLRKFLPLMRFYWRAIAEVSATGFLMVLACYCFGLLLGSTPRKLLVVGGCLSVPPLMMSLVVAKGFEGEAMVVLGLLILASLARVTTRFSSTPL